MRNYLADYNLYAVSAGLKETALNTEQPLDTSMLIAANNIIQIDPRREDNKDELTGMEEADTIYALGAMASGTMDFNKAQAQHFAFGYGFGLGGVASAAWGTGHEHIITPVTDPFNPAFTAAMRLGSTIMKRRFASMHVDTLKASFAKDSWAKLALGLKGTGKYTDNMYKETVNFAYNAVSLTLAANGVQGSTAALRLDSVHSIRAQAPTGEWVDVVFTVVSAATPAVITITAPGGVATVVPYEIIYTPIEPAWCAFPARVSEPPLRVSDLTLKIGAKWDGTVITGGHTMSQEINSIEHNLNNNMAIEYRVGGTQIYANYSMRGGRVQTLNLDRQMRDFLLQQKMADTEYMVVQLKATGVEFETGKAYYVDLVFPRCAVLKAPISVDGKILAEKGDISVLQDATYGSVRVKVGNKVTSYAQ